MIKLRDQIEHYILKAENLWKVLSTERQRLLIKVFFGAYVLLTAVVIINGFIGKGKRSNTIAVDHIDGISKKSASEDFKHIDTLNSILTK
ncbi:hypothetical protein [uncultured Chryseobacterium sp.]|nr:hypothetical protein [uncultured Chryseobacterium sp.]